MMKYVFICCVLVAGCRQPDHPPTSTSTERQATPLAPYAAVKKTLANEKKKLAVQYPVVTGPTAALTNFWVKQVGTELYQQWHQTPWDFNGTTEKPRDGAIACGYFVTTVLRDMGVKINRSKLAICPSLTMMKTLVPGQKVSNLSYLSFDAFNQTIQQAGKGVYIIGLDFHTGFIINDGRENWFLHSNYIKRQGVVKEVLLSSSALKSSKTRWVVSLTKDRDFLRGWLKG
ncbi:MAG: hypothetical protein EOO06_20720 [Chitinophagaceae bacterium]|nr:MAG: hypothetical protein EOO06_20720 [Chitinophagaceae bacterium]